MKKGKRLLALVVALSLVVGLAPMYSTSYAEDTAESTGYSETVMLQDDFDNGSSWDTTSTESGRWYLGDSATNLAGVRNDVAPLGYQQTHAYNFYDHKDGDMVSDVHLKSMVCVTADSTYTSHAQYHFLLARVTDRTWASGTTSVAFGFKTLKDAEYSSLVVCQYAGSDNPTPIYETSAKYPIGEENVYELELFVLGSLVVATCKTDETKEIIFAEEIEGIAAEGYCGILSRRATTLITTDSLSKTSVYGTDYTKNGYFDAFSLSIVNLGSVEVDGPVIVGKDGNGIADIIIKGNDTGSNLEIKDVAVSVNELANQPTDLYEGTYTATLTGFTTTQQTAIAQRIFVVDDISNAVTSMSDERWEGKDDGDPANFTVDALGKATLTNNAYSVLDKNKDNTSYSDFYAEYTLNVSNISDETYSFFYSRYNITGRASHTTSFSGDVLYDTREGKDEFYARLYQRPAASGGVVGANYASGTSTGKDVEIGASMTIGLLVYDNQVKYTVNGYEVATYSGTTNLENGFFALYNEIGSSTNASATATSTVEDFICISLADKTAVGHKVLVNGNEVSETGVDVSLGEELGAVTVVPEYNWPNSDGAEVTDTASIEVLGYNKAVAGTQDVIVTYNGVSETIKVNVIDNSVTTLVDENFNDGQNPFTEWTSNTAIEIKDVNDDGDNEVLVGESANVKSTDTFKDGYIEAKVAIHEWTATEEGTLYPMVLDCKRASSGGARVEARFVVTRAQEEYSAYFELVVREGNSLGNKSTYRKTAKALEDFALDKEYKVRLTCIGNYVEVMLDDNIELQYTFTADTLDTVDGTYGFTNVAGVTATLDDLRVVEYVPYSITVDAENTVSLPSYPIVQAINTTAERTKIASGEEVILTVPEDKQLAVGGLGYKIDGITTPYTVSQRLYGAGEQRDVCNQFVFSMPSGNIALTADYYEVGAEDNANIGMKEVAIREKTDERAYGLRFSSRAYTTYVKDGVTYTLKEVGTLLFNENVGTITEEILNACRISDGGEYKDDNGTTIGKSVTAKYAQDICNDFWDWGVILTYEDESEYFKTKYTAYSYGIYVNENDANDKITVYASEENSATYSYNDVASAIGYATH